MNRFCVCTFAVGEFYEKLAELSHPTIAAYAQKCGADFFVGKKLDGPNACYTKFKMVRELLEKYERVLYVDSDILIRFDAPSIFALVRPEDFGAFNELEMFPERRRTKASFPMLTGAAFEADWITDKIYFNAGVFLVSRAHKEIFREIPTDAVNCYGEQTFLNYRFAESGASFHNLPHRFNKLISMNRATGQWLDDAYFLHFAGAFTEEPLAQLNYEEWQAVAKRFDGYRAAQSVPAMPRRIYVQTLGALGDCVAGEPAVRYLREVLAPDADLTIRTLFPQVFAHLAAFPLTTILGPGDTADDKGHLKLNLLPEKSLANYNQMHPLDYATLCLFHGHLPKAARRIKLATNSEAPAGIENYVLVHPGKTWPSRTIPAQWWNEIIDGLIAKRIPVALIGKTYGDGERGTVEVCARRCLDLRNKQSIGELFATIKAARLLVSNDSSPIHISGAFDNPTILITTAKEPEFIWPDRDSSLNISFGRPIRQSRQVGIVTGTSLHACTSEEMLAVLPDPHEVVTAAMKAYVGSENGGKYDIRPRPCDPEISRSHNSGLRFSP